jgi:transcriptional regulator with XRE-family HTH domain
VRHRSDTETVSDITKALGLRIRDLRKAAGYSQEAFADACGVHRTFMGTMERGGSNVSLMNIVKVAVTLDITLAQLFEGVEAAAKPTPVSKPKAGRKG